MLPLTIVDKPATVTQLDVRNLSNQRLDVELLSAGQPFVRMPVEANQRVYFSAFSGIDIDPPLVARHNGPEGSIEVTATTIGTNTV